MTEKYAMLSNVKSLELATKELRTKIDKIRKLQEEIAYLGKVKKEKEGTMKKQLKTIGTKIKDLNTHVSKANKKTKTKKTVKKTKKKTKKKASKKKKK